MSKEIVVKVDSHCHLSSDEMYNDVDEIIKRALDQNVEKIVNICTCPKTLERGQRVAEKYPNNVFTTVATTPHDVEKDGEKHFAVHEKAIRSGKICGVGETGLDYHYEHSNRDVQKKFLHRYVDLAIDTNLPIVFHCRADEAFEDLFKIAKEKKPFSAVLHCFTGNLEQAKQVCDLGWFVSVSGIITFKRSDDLRQVIKEVPLEHLFIETDAPYLAPQSKRGQINEPAFIVETAQRIASIKGETLEKVSQTCTKNTCNFFRI